MQDSIDSLNISVISLFYYLYRQAGCPYGDSQQGLSVWIDMQKLQWKQLLKTEGIENDDSE